MFKPNNDDNTLTIKPNLTELPMDISKLMITINSINTFRNQPAHLIAYLSSQSKKACPLVLKCRRVRRIIP